MSSSGQPPSSFQQRSSMDDKVDNLVTTLQGLTLGDDVKQIIDLQIAGIRAQFQSELTAIIPRYNLNKPKAKKVKPFDGKTQTLRSFLTAIELEMEDEGITGEEAKVKYVGRYLREGPWEWFEPIVRERNEKDRNDWSPRAERILTNYSEMKKAMKQALGDIDERKTAAQDLQKLRQNRSVREYISKFQQITSRLDWDDEALGDKFLQGLKPKIQELLVYFPEEPRNLEELFGRAQKIDREHWNQQERSFHFRTGLHTRNNMVKRDRDGDIQMVGAKVDMSKAKKENLCFECGKKGHQARHCQRKENRIQNQQKTIRMMWKVSGSEETNYSQERSCQLKEEEGCDGITSGDGFNGPRNGRQAVLSEIKTAFESIRPDDSETENSDDCTDAYDWEEEQPDMDSGIKKRIEEWRESVNTEEERKVPTLKRTRRPLGQRTVRLEYPGRQPEENTEFPKRSRESYSVLGNTGQADRGVSTSARRLVTGTDLKTLTGPPFKMNEQYISRYQQRNEMLRQQLHECNCYGFNPNCWAASGVKWQEHIKNCFACKVWALKECNLPEHSTQKKQEILQDLSNRKFVLTEPVQDNQGKTCCEREECVHQFYKHNTLSSPWWVCLWKNCSIHFQMKRKNGTWPELPKVTIQNAQKCPCLRIGCVCTLDKGHDYHSSLIPEEACVHENCGQHNEQERIQGRNFRIITDPEKFAGLQPIIRRTEKDDGIAPQVEVTILVNGHEETAIIDSGANINYVNSKWCHQRGIKTRYIGYGKIKAYDGQYVQEYLYETNLTFKTQGQKHTQKFQVLKHTGQDPIVLGMPWLRKYNPTMNWSKGIVTIREEPSEPESVREPLVHRLQIQDSSKTETISVSTLRKAVLKDQEQAGRGSYNKKNAQEEQDPSERTEVTSDYEKQLQEVKERLPGELQKFTDVFCRKH
jgi:hypothetical protein